MLEIIKKISVKNEKKIVFIIIDGLGGAPEPKIKKTELERAYHPHLDRLTKISICGLHHPVYPGITSGSGPAHLGVFGYDPLKYEIGRGLLDTLGIDFDFTSDDLAARGNFATVDDNGVITDRRAGRIPTEKNLEICKKFLDLEIDGIKVFVKTVKEHRISVIFRGKNLSDKLTDSDPQKEGLKPLDVKPLTSEDEFSADIVNKFLKIAKDKLKDLKPANMILLRGFSKMIDIPKFQDIYKLTPAAIAVYPMYRGLAKLIGMDILPTGDTIRSEFETLKKYYKSNYDFFFLHIKPTDSAGEDGDFIKKVKVIEEIDNYILQVINLNPDVLLITGDHSTPAILKSHSWHPVPVLLYSKFCRPDRVTKFNENEFIYGGLGIISSQQIMPLVLANALKLNKYGA